MSSRLSLIRERFFSVRQTRTATTLSSQFAVMVVIVMAAFVDCNLMLLILLRASATDYKSQTEQVAGWQGLRDRINPMIVVSGPMSRFKGTALKLKCVGDTVCPNNSKTERAN